MYKQSPTPSIDKEGGIIVHVNQFFISKDKPFRFGDVVRLKNMKLGKRKLSKQQIADELGISVNTVKTQKQRALQLLRLKLNPETFLTLIMLLYRLK